jgi:hypothetical protein
MNEIPALLEYVGEKKPENKNRYGTPSSQAIAYPIKFLLMNALCAHFSGTEILSSHWSGI